MARGKGVIMFRQRFGGESGVALVVALIVTILGTILAGSYMTVVISESRNSVWQKHRVQSLFISEAGIQEGLYFLNNRYRKENPWVDENAMMLDTPLKHEGALADGNYEIELYSQLEMPFLPADSYLIKSEATMPRQRRGDIKRKVSCIVSKLKPISAPAAVCIFDYADLDLELLKFDSNEWTIDGRDMDALGGVLGIAVANTSDDLPAQLGNDRLASITGSDEYNNYYEGLDAIVEDPKLPKNLDDYLNYFRKIAVDISNTSLSGTAVQIVPSELMGTADSMQVLYADLSKGPLKVAAQDVGGGVLILEGSGKFIMAGGSEWNGVIICANDSSVELTGGGSKPAHIYGALLVANGGVIMSGTADVRYSSDNMAKLNAQLLIFQVYAWCEGWGIPIGEKGSRYYYPSEPVPEPIPEPIPTI